MGRGNWTIKLGIILEHPSGYGLSLEMLAHLKIFAICISCIIHIFGPQLKVSFIEHYILTQASFKSCLFVVRTLTL